MLVGKHLTQKKQLEILSCLFSVGLRVGGLVYATAYVWRSEDNVQESDLSFYHVGSGVEPRLSCLTASTLGQLQSYPIIPTITGFCCLKHDISMNPWLAQNYVDQAVQLIKI